MQHDENNHRTEKTLHCLYCIEAGLIILALIVTL